MTKIHIYRMTNTGWTHGVVDDQNSSTVWDGEFTTDNQAPDVPSIQLNAEGTEAFIAQSPNQHLH